MMSQKLQILAAIILLTVPESLCDSKPMPPSLFNRLKRQLGLFNQIGYSDVANGAYQPYHNFQTIPQQSFEHNYDFRLPQNTASHTRPDGDQLLYLPSYSASNLESSNLVDSPIYYVKLPPAPYKFMPGMGYVSQSPLNILPFQLPPMTGANYHQQQLLDPMQHSFLNLPLEFLANGKPTNVLHLNGQHSDQQQQQQEKYQQHMEPQLKGLYLQSPSLQYPYNSFALQSQADMYMHSWPKLSAKRNSLLKKLKNSLAFNGKPENIRIHPSDLSDEFETLL